MQLPYPGSTDFIAGAAVGFVLHFIICSTVGKRVVAAQPEA